MSFAAAAVEVLAPIAVDFLQKKGGELAGQLMSNAAARLGASDAVQQQVASTSNGVTSSFANNLSQNLQQAPPQTLSGFGSAILGAGISAIGAEQGAIQSALYQHAMDKAGQFLQSVSIN